MPKTDRLIVHILIFPPLQGTHPRKSGTGPALKIALKLPKA